jgi:RHS repeat-associated protein
LGSIVSITDGTRNVFQSYGSLTTSSSFRSSFTFTGREYDEETGLYFYRARYYDPRLGRFLNVDPIGFDGGDVNLYGYVGNNPVNWIDPWGFYSVDDFLQNAGDYSAGFGDTISSGFTRWVREQLGTNDVVNNCSRAYNIGEWSGYAWEMGLGLGLAGKGLQIQINVLSKGNVLKIISKRLKMGFRIDPAHHVKQWGYQHTWRW